MSTLPIADYALLSDCRSAAPVPSIGCASPGSMGRRSLPDCWMIKRALVTARGRSLRGEPPLP
jgi:hypothetical protein